MAIPLSWPFLRDLKTDPCRSAKICLKQFPEIGNLFSIKGETEMGKDKEGKRKRKRGKEKGGKENNELLYCLTI